MAAEHPLRDLLHEATHRIPGVPAHVEQPAGHQGPAKQRPAQGGNQRPAHGDEAPQPRPVGRAAAPDRSAPSSRNRSLNHSLNHAPARPPRVMAGWQRRVAKFFGQEV